MLYCIPEWRPIVGYEGYYSVSSDGQIRSEERLVRHNKGGFARKLSRLRSTHPDKDGYPTVILSKEGRNTAHKVHAVVLAAFAGPRSNGMVGCHNNGNPQDNRVENLRWDTLAGNFSDKLIHGTHARGERSAVSKLTDAQRALICADQRSDTEIAKDYAVTRGCIGHIKRAAYLWAA